MERLLDSLFGNKNDILSLIRQGNLEAAAKYVDGTIVHMVQHNSPELLAQVTTNDPERFHLWNSTLLSSVAYVILNASDPAVRAAAQQSLDGYVARASSP